jgi:CO dehydrogenase maturation factor
MGLRRNVNRGAPLGTPSRGAPLKIAIAGKGGVGKTMVSAVLARILARRGYRVLAVDVDPSLNLATSLGVPQELASGIRPISEEGELIDSRVKTSFGPVMNLAPQVDDIIDRYSVPAPDGVRLIAVGTVRAGGEGCQCPENAFLRAILAQLILARKEVAILDMAAGLEHLGRGTARGVELMLCVVEPTMKSFDAASRMVELSRDLQIGRVWGVANKLTGEGDEDFVKREAARFGLEVMALIPFDGSIVEAERRGVSPLDIDPEGKAVGAIRALSERLDGAK